MGALSVGKLRFFRSGAGNNLPLADDQVACTLRNSADATTKEDGGVEVAVSSFPDGYYAAGRWFHEIQDEFTKGRAHKFKDDI